MFLGTKRDNSIDMYAKGRHVILRIENLKPPRFEGSAHPHAKLTEAKAIEIRRRIADGEFVRALAREFQIDRKTIMNLRDRVTWRHL
jgi:hypothetical protein